MPAHFAATDVDVETLERYIAGQLRAIVGVELVIDRVEAKLKLSQNRSEADVDGVVAGLRERGDDESADAVAGARVDGASRRG